MEKDTTDADIETLGIDVELTDMRYRLQWLNTTRTDRGC